MDDLSGNYGQPKRRGWPKELENVSAPVRLILADDFVTITADEGADLTVEITDLIFGPLDLGSATV
jgi:hypothetical protein